VAGRGWQALLDAEALARRKIGDVQFAGGDIGLTVRAWWQTVSDVLNGYSRLIAMGENVTPPPVEIAVVLGNLAAYLAVGKIPGPIADAVTEGRHAPGPTESRDIGLAVAYRKACLPNGIEHCGETIKISDPHAVKTLQGLFGVCRTTVQGWVKNCPAAYLGANPVGAELLTDMTRSAGARYLGSGRSNIAIGARATKRRPDN